MISMVNAMKPNNTAILATNIDTALASKGPVVAVIRTALPNALAIYVFGSRSNATAGNDSDLDLAVLVAGYAPSLLLFDLSGVLEDIVGCAVDVLDLRAASTVMQYQILQKGRRLWGREPEAGLFEAFVLSEKTALDTARAGLLADIQRTGSIYG